MPPVITDAPADVPPGTSADVPTLPPHLSGLTPEQRAAVLHGAEAGAGLPPPLLIIAGAGSGKTNTLAHRVAHLVAGGTDPGRILLLTFSRRAADEMTRRVGRILAQVAPGRSGLLADGIPYAGTFHGLGARLLREYAPHIGLSPDFNIHDREDSADLMNLCRQAQGLSEKGKRFPLKGTCLAIYSAVVNTQAPLAEVLQQTFPWCVEWEAELKALFLAYVEAKQAQGVLDYDDLLLYWARMVEEAAIARDLGQRFAHVMVDEYQDTNRLQAALLLAMKPDGQGLTVVGDDAQSIYRFRGATVRNILDFPGHFDPPARVLSLTRNYRSTPPILAAANAVIGAAREGYGKALWSERKGEEKPRLITVRDEADQAGCVTEAILARREQGIRLKSQAVLFRAAHHSIRLELELSRRNIPFVKFGGLKFLEAAHVKDVLAILRWAQNPRDRVSGFRTLQLLPGVGPRTATRLLDQIANAPPGCLLLAEQPVPEACRSLWAEFAPLVEAVARADTPWPGPVEAIARWYEGELPRLYDDAPVRAADITQLARIAATYPNRERFLTELTLDPPEATSGEAGPPLQDEDYLILSTIHSAKGREWQAVALLNVVDGCLPSDLATGSEEEIEEERRLLYVAMTRAKDHLDLMLPQRFHVSGQTGLGDRHVYAARTRFITHAMLPHFNAQVWPLPGSPEAAARGPQGLAQPINLGDRMRDMWR